MKRFFTVAVLFLILAALPQQTFAGDKALGVRAGYNTRAQAPVAGIWFQYSFSNHFRIAPNIDYYFRHENVDALSINTNVQFPFTLVDTKGFAIYPLAGINYTSWNLHSTEHNDDASDRLNRFGLNLGAGLEYHISPTLKIAIEAKSGLVKSYSSATVCLAVGYCF